MVVGIRKTPRQAGEDEGDVASKGTYSAYTTVAEDEYAASRRWASVVVVWLQTPSLLVRTYERRLLGLGGR